MSHIFMWFCFGFLGCHKHVPEVNYFKPQYCVIAEDGVRGCFLEKDIIDELQFLYEHSGPARLRLPQEG